MASSANNVGAAIAWIKRNAATHGSLRNAARVYARKYPAHAAHVMDEIGMHPSSEPELRALQDVY